MKTEKKILLNMPLKLHQALRKEAFQNEMSLSEYIRTILEDRPNQ